MATFSDSMRARSDERLVALLQHRPDLASPSPATLLSLAARATSRASLQRATGALDAAHLQVLDAVVVLDGLEDGLTVDRVIAAVVGPAHETADETGDGPSADTGADHTATDRASAAAILRTLEEMALVWAPEPGTLRPAPGLEELQDPHPAGLGPLGRSQETVPDVALLDDAPAGARNILAALTWGPPVGRMAATAGGPAAAATKWLVGHGFIKQADAQHVVLPRRVAMALRGGRTHRGLLRAPAPASGSPRPARAPETVTAESARSAQEAVRRVAELLAAWQVAPPAVLKSGGLAVRDLRRLALRIEATEAEAALVAELALMTGLVVEDGDDPAAFSPTLHADDWLAAELPARWAALVAAWATSARTPWLVGTRDDRGVLHSALEPELHRAWVPRLRGEILDVLAGAPLVPMDAQDVLAVLRWRSPRSVPPVDAVAALLHEAETLGLVGAGALAPPGVVLARVPRQTVPDDAVVLELAASLAASLPRAVDEMLLQGDLTGIVPGRPSAPLEALLADSAEVESRGSALTVRFTSQSVTRALDTGRTGDDLLAELAVHSRTPVPQPLEYLVRDAARRHGQVRLGAASSYVRVEDPTLLAGMVEDPALRPLGLFRIAPTVLVASAPIGQLLAALRERGMAPAMEGPDGQVVLADRRTPRARAAGGRRRHGPGPRPALPTAAGAGSAAPVRGDDLDQTARLTALVGLLRAQTPPPPESPAATGAALSDDGPTVQATTTGSVPRRAGAEYRHRDATRPATTPSGTSEPAVALGTLREAVADGREVWLDMTGPHGEHQRRRVRPMRLDAGRLRAVDVARESELTVAVHRIISVEHVP